MPETPTLFKKPSWLNKKINFKACHNLNRLLEELNLNTICQQARCPNIGECFSTGVATFLILGKVCTRGCRFCAVQKGAPQKLDTDEPGRIAEAVKRLNLRHAVITSVTRDDLPDGGANAFYETAIALKELHKNITVELLIPDFQGRDASLKKVLAAGVDILGHNLETVPRLYAQVRKEADYQRSLRLLETIKRLNRDIHTKSGIMLGLGESEQEVFAVFSDLRKVECDFLSIGQYLAPSLNSVQVQEYLSPQRFSSYKRKAEELGFVHVKSAPYVRSSYLASEYKTPPLKEWRVYPCG